jgi:glyoxylase-like metal-dependent hydrolase (beta-lactamase superfamily II)
VHRWQIGEVEVVRIEDEDFSLSTDETMPAWAIPALAPDEHQYRVAFSALAIRDGDHSIVVDPWILTDRTGDDAADRAAGLLDQLDSVGHPPDDVDAVVLSHLDGIGWTTRPVGDGWAPSFARARHLIPADELAAIEAGEDLPGRDDFLRLAEQTPVEPVAGTMLLSPAVTLEPAPGHSFGHQVVRVDTGDHLAVYFGHLVLHPLQFAHPGEDPAEADTVRAAASRRRYLDELADRDGIALTTLVGGPGGGRVSREGDGYRI